MCDHEDTLPWERGIWGIKGSPAAAEQPQPHIPIPSPMGTEIPAGNLPHSPQGKGNFPTLQQTLVNLCGKWLQAGIFGKIPLSWDAVTSSGAFYWTLRQKKGGTGTLRSSDFLWDVFGSL